MQPIQATQQNQIIFQTTPPSLPNPMQQIQQQQMQFHPPPPPPNLMNQINEANQVSTNNSTTGISSAQLNIDDNIATVKDEKSTPEPNDDDGASKHDDSNRDDGPSDGQLQATEHHGMNHGMHADNMNEGCSNGPPNVSMQVPPPVQQQQSQIHQLHLQQQPPRFASAPIMAVPPPMTSCVQISSQQQQHIQPSIVGIPSSNTIITQPAGTQTQQIYNLPVSLQPPPQQQIHQSIVSSSGQHFLGKW